MRLFLFSILFTLVIACDQQSETGDEITENDYFPVSSEGEKFDREASDPRAVELAMEVIDSMGGPANWKRTRYLTWNFFNARRWLWDKYTGDIRMDSKEDSLVVLMNIHTREGEAYFGDSAITDPDSLRKYLEFGYKAWINDSYWLVMPFKLLDPGVKLTYIGEKSTPDGVPSDVIRLSFDAVGVTPQNMYDVYIDKKTKRVAQWTYYRDSTMQNPLTTPWANYQKYGMIYLSGERGYSRLTQIDVFDSINRIAFEEPDPLKVLKSKEPKGTNNN